MTFDHTKPFTTRDGRRAEIAWTDGGGPYPLMGRIRNSQNDYRIVRWSLSGAAYSCDPPADLVNAPEPLEELFINVDEHGIGWSWKTRKAADEQKFARLGLIRLLRNPVTRAPVSVCLIDPSTGEPIPNRGEGA